VKKLTLGQLFIGGAIAIAVTLATSFVLLVRRAHASMLRTAETHQELAATRVSGRVAREIGRAERVLSELEQEIRAGAADPTTPESLEAPAFGAALVEPRIEEIAFTHARIEGWDDAGEAVVKREEKWQLALFRDKRGSLVTRITRSLDGGAVFETLVRRRDADPSLAGTPFARSPIGHDPTQHPTFAVVTSKRLWGVPVWSDLHWSESDSDLPEGERRVVVSVQKTVDDVHGAFLGVLRVALLTDELDAIASAKGSPSEPEDVARVVLLAATEDRRGVRLLARVAGHGRVASIPSADEIRVVAETPPQDVAALLASPVVQKLDPVAPRANGVLSIDGEPWLATLRPIDVGRGGTRGWAVALLQPESSYTRDLLMLERRILYSVGLTLFLVLAIGVATVQAVRRGLVQIVRDTYRMRGFDFASRLGASHIRDIDEVMRGLERAKTVVRAMGKYVPIEVVRRLFAENKEPELGGELLDVTLMFTDIESFTALSEMLDPDVLARRLGAYLEAMTAAIEGTGGTIDKYIGDAVMAIWNAPVPLAEHAKRACKAALMCRARVERLYASEDWRGLPALVTRFGIHEARVMVGNFGTPSRLSYTALGDGVNLAARLEPLCKQYGVTVLVSETVALHAKEEFVFRRIDRVAVKGKTEGIDVYELLGAAGEPIAKRDVASQYEAALVAYLRRDFAHAAELLDAQKNTDPPSAVLHARALAYAAAPPPADWNGVWVALTK
jgi:adenylate cyclase